MTLSTVATLFGISIVLMGAYVIWYRCRGLFACRTAVTAKCHIETVHARSKDKDRDVIESEQQRDLRFTYEYNGQTYSAVPYGCSRRLENRFLNDSEDYRLLIDPRSPRRARLTYRAAIGPLSSVMETAMYSVMVFCNYVLLPLLCFGFGGMLIVTG